MDTDELARQARTLIDQGQKIEAIKLVRETTGWGLKESKDYVDALARAALPALGESKSYVDTLTGGGTVNWIFIASNVRDLLAQGRKDEAVDWVVAQARKDEAVDWVVAQARMDAQEAREYVGFMDRSAQSPPDGWDLPAQVDSQIRDLLDQNRKVEAVKLVCILTNWGLRESKDYVDALEMDRGGNNHHRSAPPGPMQFSPPSKIGRNDPCPCGSGRKYKHCCGKKH